LETAQDANTSPEDLAMTFNRDACPTAREIVLEQNRANKVLLKLEEVNLLYARDFIDMMLNPKKKGSVI